MKKNIQVSSLKDNAYFNIKQKLLNCEYAPGDFINEKQLISEFGMSRTPIREAIIRLEQDGFLDILPKRGIVVKKIVKKDIVELFEYRIMVESYAIRNKGYLYDKEELKKFRKRFLEDSDMDKELDDKFHKFLQDVLNNHYILNNMQVVWDQNYRARILAYSGTRSLRDTINEHLAIVDALLANDFVVAEASLIMHLEAAKNGALKRIPDDVINI